MLPVYCLWAKIWKSPKPVSTIFHLPKNLKFTYVIEQLFFFPNLFSVFKSEQDKYVY